jgi:exopolyphosphatase/guanosine-5'-triphosphate,3'-diphosphate pyrophosphatase
VKIAAIDIGSNSIKLIVVDAAASNSFAVLTREREVVRLGHDTLLKGYISRAAIDRSTECIRRFRSIAEARGAEQIVAIATASVREANNSRNFIKAIAQRSGVRIEVLSGIEEARLIGLAASEGCSKSGSTNLNIDIGGGSTEISIFNKGQPSNLLSVKLGAVGLTERFLHADPPRTDELKALRSEIRAALERPARELSGVQWTDITGTSGTILVVASSLASSNQNQNDLRPDGAKPPEKTIELSALASWNSSIAKWSTSERQQRAGLSLQRAEIITAGGQILEGVMRALGIKALRTCDWALREGVIIDRLRDWEAQSRPVMPDISDQKLRGVHAVGKRFGYEEPHAHQVARLAEELFDSIAGSAQLTRHDRLMLSAAALLHDVGYHIAHESHHKHSFYLIANSELTGFSESERALIANIARYHKGSGPKERHLNFSSLSLTDRETVRKLAGVLRLADAFDRRHDSRVKDIQCRRVGDVINVKLLSASECENELEEANRRVGLFEQSFGRTVRLSSQKIESNGRQAAKAKSIK